MLLSQFSCATPPPPRAPQNMYSLILFHKFCQFFIMLFPQFRSLILFHMSCQMFIMLFSQFSCIPQSYFMCFVKCHYNVSMSFSLSFLLKFYQNKYSIDLSLLKTKVNYDINWLANCHVINHKWNLSCLILIQICHVHFDLSRISLCCHIISNLF